MRQAAAAVLLALLAACGSGSGGGHVIVTPSYPEGLPTPGESLTSGPAPTLPPPPPIGCCNDPTGSGGSDAADAASKTVERDGSAGDAATYLDAADLGAIDAPEDVTDSAASDAG